jgi:pimeloyl-ACP methyl ester carboxylesterase
MKIRFDREALLHFSPYPKLFILGKKDPVLNAEDLLDQVKGTDVQKLELPDGHMSHIENQQEVLEALQNFVKQC